MVQEQQLTVKYKSVTHAGSKMKHNQEAYAEFQVPGGYGFAVCDGINGKEGGGAIASKMAIESIKRQFRNTQFKNPQKALTNALTLANFQLFDHAQKNERFKGFGTSCGIILVINELVYYAYIGNIRVYFFRDNTIYRLTRDHTKAQTALLQNKIKEEQLETHEGFYIVDRALGFEKDVNFSVCKQPIALEENDLLLLTTDGLFKEISETQIAELLNNPDASVDFIADNLARKADEAGGRDNITLSLLHAFDPSTVPFTPEINETTEIVGFNKKTHRFVWVIIGILALIAVLYGITEMVFTNEQVAKRPKQEAIKKTIVKQNEPKKEKTQKADPPVEDLPVIEKEPSHIITPKYINHKIDKGENFYRLGIRFNVTVQVLERVNNVQAKRLRFGQRVRIPVKNIYTVGKGESLSVIAEKFQTPVKDLLKANALNNPNSIREGMALNIPLQYDDKIAE